MLVDDHKEESPQASAASSSYNPIDAQPRDIASGAIQRERRKRDKLKDWQACRVISNLGYESLEEVEEDDRDAQVPQNSKAMAMFPNGALTSSSVVSNHI